MTTPITIGSWYMVLEETYVQIVKHYPYRMGMVHGNRKFLPREWTLPLETW